MKKTIRSLLLILAALFISGAASAEQWQDYQYSIQEDGTAEITAYFGISTELIIIPSDLDGHSVTSIGEQAFVSHWIMTSIITPDSVTSIGDSAFSITTSGNLSSKGSGQLVLTVGPGSYAEKYAADNHIEFVYPQK